MLLADVGILEILSSLDRIGLAGVCAGGCIAIWKYWTKRLDDVEKAHAFALTAKDTLINTLQAHIAKREQDHSLKIEQLQSVTIEKIEDWGEKTGSLVERVIEVQAQTNQTVRSLSLIDGPKH